MGNLSIYGSLNAKNKSTPLDFRNDFLVANISCFQMGWFHGKLTPLGLTMVKLLKPTEIISIKSSLLYYGEWH
jgi:hypothetical protein